MFAKSRYNKAKDLEDASNKGLYPLLFIRGNLSPYPLSEVVYPSHGTYQVLQQRPVQNFCVIILLMSVYSDFVFRGQESYTVIQVVIQRVIKAIK